MSSKRQFLNLKVDFLKTSSNPSASPKLVRISESPHSQHPQIEHSQREKDFPISYTISTKTEALLNYNYLNKVKHLEFNSKCFQV